MSESLTAIKDQLETWKNRARMVRVETEQVADRAFNAGATLAGGGITGLLRAKYGEGPNSAVHIPGTEIDAPTLIAVIALGAGVSGMAGKKSDLSASFGAGIGAVVLADMVQQKMTAAPRRK
jgi:hypothetical protein